jgi:hypothetical protein
VSVSMTRQPVLRVNSDPSLSGSGSVSVSSLAPDLLAFLRDSPRSARLLQSSFRVTVDHASSPEVDGLPAVSGRYLLFEDEVQFIPHFPFESDIKYRASFDPHWLGDPFADPISLEFQIPVEQKSSAPAEVTQVFPSSDVLPENLLRFYVCFSNSMQRGKALDEISLLDSEGRPVADVLYRHPIELWDRTMRRLTVLLDPGRLKRWVGPNVELGPPLKAGEEYTLEIGSGMFDREGRRLPQPFRKRFVVGDPVQEKISVASWRILPPVTGSRHALSLMFKDPLDWAILFRAITVSTPDRSVIEGQVAVDQCEKRWNFTPSSPWMAGTYRITVGSGLEDVCGNTVTGAFDKPLSKNFRPVDATTRSSLSFQLM